MANLIPESCSVTFHTLAEPAPGELDVAEGSQGQLSPHLEGTCGIQTLRSSMALTRHQWEFSALLRAKEASQALPHFLAAPSLHCSPTAPNLQQPEHWEW